ncbi:MAG TPA: hypothetical protein VEU62_14460, partial [Bryobacterales bacterium]|nr:hypothetical protein [Bryobacterales bacterium]
MRTIVLTIVLTMMLAAAAAAANSPFAGTWDGTINDLPGVEITIQDAGGQLSGAVIFYFQKRGPDGKWRVEGKDT